MRPFPLRSPAADAYDFGENDVTSVTIVTGNIRDGAFETVTVGGSSFDLSADATRSAIVGGTPVTITYVATTGTFTVTPDGGTYLPNTALDALLQGVKYENLDQSPTAGDRTLTFTATDTGGLTSAPAVATITVVPVNDVPVLDLNSGATPADASRDNAVTFTEGDAPISVAALAADVSDITEADVTKLTIVAAGVQDGSFENVTIGGRTFDLSADSTQTATIGGTSVQIAYDASTGTFTITNAAGASTPMAEADLDALVRSITYENIDQNPVAGDRTLTFTASDAGGLTSAPAVATITVVPVNDRPVVDLNGPSTGPSTPLTSLVNGGLNGPAALSGLPTGWIATNITPDTVTTNGPFNGGLPWVLSPEGGTFVRSATGGQEAFGQQLTGLVPGQAYEVTFYQTNIGLINPGSTQFYGSGYWDIRLDGSSVASSPVMDTWTGGKHPTTHNNEWQQVTLTFTATAASQFIEFRGMSPDDTTAMGIDAIVIKSASAVDYAKTFTEGDVPVNVADTLLADVDDFTEADITELKIVVAGVQDGSFEKVAIGGVVFDLTADSTQDRNRGRHNR